MIHRTTLCDNLCHVLPCSMVCHNARSQGRAMQHCWHTLLSLQAVTCTPQSASCNSSSPCTTSVQAQARAASCKLRYPEQFPTCGATTLVAASASASAAASAPASASRAATGCPWQHLRAHPGASTTWANVGRKHARECDHESGQRRSPVEKWPKSHTLGAALARVSTTWAVRCLAW